MKIGRGRENIREEEELKEREKEKNGTSEKSKQSRISGIKIGEIRLRVLQC